MTHRVLFVTGDDGRGELVVDDLAAEAALRTAGCTLPIRLRAVGDLDVTEERFRSLFEHAPICLWEEDGSELVAHFAQLRAAGIVDLGAYFRDHPEEAAACIPLVKVLDVNQAALRHYGARDKAELLAGIGHTMTPDSMSVFAVELAAFAEGKLVFEAETTTRTLAGAQNHVLMSVLVAPGSEASLSHVYVSMVDITTSKRAEQQARALEEQLRQSQKMDAIGHLAGGIAHDFNNLLTVIAVNTELLKRGRPGTEVDAIAVATARAGDLIRQLLAFSRQQVLEPRDLELNAIVANVAKLLERVVPRNIEVRLDLAAYPVWTRADASTIDQILINLVVNARDAMPEGGSLVIATAAMVLDEEDRRMMPELAPGAYARLRLTDTGVGIPPENLARIFEPFFTTKEVGKGTGLGLATVFGIVKQQEGAIAVTSEVGRGTTFSILLPAARETIYAEEAPGDVAIVPRGGTEMILVVEDEALIRRAVQEVLATSGYAVQVATNAAEAIAMLTADAHIALVLTDLEMPGAVSGRGLSEWLSAHRPQVRVLYMSGYSAGTAGLALRAGVNFLQKPFGPVQLLACVRSRLDD